MANAFAVTTTSTIETKRLDYDYIILIKHEIMMR